MKKSLHKILYTAAAGLIALTACNKQQAIVTFEGGTAPVLTSTATDSIPLSINDSTANAVTFNWTNPNYQYSDGISSMDVTYYLEFDTVSTFNSSILYTVGISSSLSQTFTVSQLNSIVVNNMGLATGNQHTLYVGIQSFIEPFTSTSARVGVLNSAPLTFTVDPYSLPPAVTPPAASDTLVLVGGDVLLGAWSNPVPASQAFTRMSATDFQLTIALSGGDPTNTNGTDQYLILPVNGSWSNKYACASTSSQPFSGGTFGYNLSSNFPGPTAAGTYKFDLNFQTGILTVTLQ
jgi:starch-binding outer membrane protein SusE/F